MIKRLPLGMISIVMALLAFVPAKYFIWGVLIFAAESVGLLHKHMLPSMKEVLTLRGLTTLLLFVAPIVLAPVVLWGPYTVAGVVVDQSFSLIIGFLLISSYVVGFIQDQRND